MPGEFYRLESAYFLLTWFSSATLLLLRAADRLLIRNSISSLSLLRSTVHIAYSVLAKCTDSQAIIEYKMVFSSVSRTLLFFQNGAVPFLQDWSGLPRTTVRLAALPLSLCSACVQLRCLYLQVISTVGQFLGDFFNEGYVLKACFTLLLLLLLQTCMHTLQATVYSRVLACP